MLVHNVINLAGAEVEKQLGQMTSEQIGVWSHMAGNDSASAEPKQTHQVQVHQWNSISCNP